MAQATERLPEILATHRFYVGLLLDGRKEDSDCYFLECQGFKRTQDAIEVCEVTPNKWGVEAKGLVVRTKIPGNVKSGNITLKRGTIANSMVFWKWFEEVQNSQWAKKRQLMALSIYNQANQEQARFELAGAWPASYKIADLNARSTDLHIEELEIAFEEFKRVK